MAMTYGMNRVITALEFSPTWVQNLITYADMVELAAQGLTVKFMKTRLESMARERRDNK
jgi:hypothetical protein